MLCDFSLSRSAKGLISHIVPCFCFHHGLVFTLLFLSNLVKENGTVGNQIDEERSRDSQAENGCPTVQNNLQALNKLRYEISERDHIIKTVNNENDDYKSQLDKLKLEHVELKHQYEIVDSALADLVASTHLETGSVELNHLDALKEFKLHWVQMLDQIAMLERRKAENASTTDDLRQKIVALEKSMDVLSAENAALRERQRRESQTTRATIRSLEKSLSETTEQNKQLKERLRESGTSSTSQIQELEEQLRQSCEALARASAVADAAVRERDTARKELREQGEKTRKLLFTLGLANDADKASLSLDHARNISYSRRRRSSVQGKIPLPLGGTNNKREPPNVNLANVTETGRDFTAHVNAESDRKPSVTQPECFYSESVESARDSDLAASMNGPPTTKNDSRCVVCGKLFSTTSNFDGACVFHGDGAIKLYVGTELEVWSCCRSTDTLKGCLKGRHKSEAGN